MFRTGSRHCKTVGARLVEEHRSIEAVEAMAKGASRREGLVGGVAIAFVSLMCGRRNT